MDKGPPARQTRLRPMTIEAGPSYFSHDGGAVRTEQSRGVAFC